MVSREPRVGGAVNSDGGEREGGRHWILGQDIFNLFLGQVLCNKNSHTLLPTEPGVSISEFGLRR